MTTRTSHRKGALIVGVIGLIVAIGGLLWLTALRPSDRIEADGAPVATAEAVYTRAGVLSLFKGPVSVSADAEDGHEVSIVVGRSYDVSAYAAALKASEVTGLKTYDSLIVSSPEETNPALTAEPQTVTDSDMWLRTVTDSGHAEVHLDDSVDTLSVMAVSPGHTAPTLTISWPREVALWPGITVLCLGLFLLLVAGVLWWLARMASARDNGAEAEAEAEPGEVCDDEVGDEADDDAIAALIVAGGIESDGNDDEPQRYDHTDEGDGFDDQPEDNERDDEHTVDESDDESGDDGEVVGAALDDGPHTDDHHETTEGDTDATVVDEADDALGRDSVKILPEQPHDLVADRSRHDDYLEHAMTGEIPGDGMREIHAATGEIRVPTRRALREARLRGEGSIVIDGHTFTTGSIPLVEVEEYAQGETTMVEVPEGDADRRVEEQIQSAEESVGKREEGVSLRQRLRRRREQYGKERQ